MRRAGRRLERWRRDRVSNQVRAAVAHLGVLHRSQSRGLHVVDRSERRGLGAGANSVRQRASQPVFSAARCDKGLADRRERREIHRVCATRQGCRPIDDRPLRVGEVADMISPSTECHVSLYFLHSRVPFLPPPAAVAARRDRLHNRRASRARDSSPSAIVSPRAK